MPMENSQRLSMNDVFSSSEYFNEMRKVSQKVKPHIEQIINEVGQKHPDLSKDFYFYYAKRVFSRKLLLRPFIFKVFLDLYNVDWEEHLELAAIIEMVNISTYQSNLAFDNKCGVNNQKERSNQYISSFFSKLKIFSKVMDLESYSIEQKKQIITIITKAYERLYYGQYIDINELNFKNLSIINSDAIFNEIYRKRCGLIGGSLIEMIAELSFLIANKKDFDLQHYLNIFSFHFGLAGQVVNDIGDLSNKGKTYTDKYFDLYNKKVTFPIREVILQTNSLDEESLISFIETEENLNIIKNKTRCYIERDIRILDENIESLLRIGKNTSQLCAIRNIVTRSVLIN